MSGPHGSASNQTAGSAACGSCGRFVGPAQTCPYCGADVVPAVRLRVLQLLALGFGIIGLGVLCRVSIWTELPVVAIKDITPGMNFGLVRVRGRVLRDCSVTERQGQVVSARFVVDDGTGHIRVTLNRAAAQAVVAGDALPAAGDAVDAAGTLDVSASAEPRLYVHAASRLAIERRAHPRSSPASEGPM